MDRLIEPITPSGERVPLALMRTQGRLRRELVPQICRLRTAPLHASIFAAWALMALIVRKIKEENMEKNDIEELRARVGCAAFLEHEGFAIDRKESTRRAVKFRRDDDIIIVIHDDRGWFDVRSDAKGDVFALASYLRGIGFTEALTVVGDLVAFQPTAPTWEKPLRQTQTGLRSLTAGTTENGRGAHRRRGAIFDRTGRCHGRSSLLPSKQTLARLSA
ncbi:hypothetical protein [Rhizobium herbae]|uniref:DUF3991 domain-containing protein n=1 Tax=Rhizobium herbae TaxID=508661 RepID=A0ABS4EUQ4_9HYPH|nr:hypothetical protein [Rhizobium herbae]MBP1861683.1 hypothetical protein [Rhizobium herbae]